METVYVFFADGFEEIEALTAVDVLRRAGLKVEMVSTTSEDVVTGAHGVVVTCDLLFDECDFMDAVMLLLPGGMPGAASLSKHKGLRELLLDYNSRKKPIAAICAAPMALGKLGLLKGRKATCYPGFESYLAGAECIDQQVVKDGHIITANGPGAAMAFSLAVVEFLLGKEKVQELVVAMGVKN
ncbi:DJ-1 family glyoxalase III [uncultured Bacteroides sp.]|uniref:DJ-1 family glyoxalase III n=1 Tax=uncultured Bacteroides sp. TaxID=162156 RepID=UPI002AA5FC09|nr:DJ-1 family glyoxalase III [uncultured Bacteroides sp.]